MLEVVEEEAEETADVMVEVVVPADIQVAEARVHITPAVNLEHVQEAVAVAAVEPPVKVAAVLAFMAKVLMVQQEDY